MSHPKAYEPVQGYQYQILCSHPQYNGREWEHCDYAVYKADKKHLITEYRLAYTSAYEFKVIPLPVKYHSPVTYSRNQLINLPTISQGHTANLKYDDGYNRIWVERTTIADGAEINHMVTIETLSNGIWKTTKTF